MKRVVILKHPTDLREIAGLNVEAFPPEERIEIERLSELSATGGFELLAAYDAQRFVGFVFLAVCRPSVYLFLLAVDSSLRSCGYGGAILKTLNEWYPDSQIVVDIQPVDAQAENMEQRQKRRAFYLDNGYCPVGCQMIFQGMEFDLLSNRACFDLEAFKQVVHVMNKNGFELHLKA